MADLFYTLSSGEDKVKENFYTAKLKMSIQSGLQLTATIKYTSSSFQGVSMY